CKGVGVGNRPWHRMTARNRQGRDSLYRLTRRKTVRKDSEWGKHVEFSNLRCDGFLSSDWRQRDDLRRLNRQAIVCHQSKRHQQVVLLHWRRDRVVASDWVGWNDICGFR